MKNLLTQWAAEEENRRLMNEAVRGRSLEDEVEIRKIKVLMVWSVGSHVTFRLKALVRGLPAP